MPGAAVATKDQPKKARKDNPNVNESDVFVDHLVQNKEPINFELPAIFIITGQTGSGKTFFLRQLIDNVVKNRKFLPKYGYEDPAKRIIYVGQFDPRNERSGDEEHNQIVTDLLDMSPESGEVISYSQAQEEANKENEESSDLAAILGRSGDSSSVMTVVMKKIKEMAKEGDIFIMDDLQHYLPSMTGADKKTFVQMANAFVHHKGISLIFLFQVLPSTGPHSLLGNLVNNTNYLFQITRQGVNSRELRRLFELAYGNSAMLLNQVRMKILEEGGHPQFVLFDKKNIYFPSDINGCTFTNDSGTSRRNDKANANNGQRTGNNTATANTGAKRSGTNIFSASSSDSGIKRIGGNSKNYSTQKGASQAGNQKAKEGPKRPTWWPD
jgi:hypothetical protein